MMVIPYDPLMKGDEIDDSEKLPVGLTRINRLLQTEMAEMLPIEGKNLTIWQDNTQLFKDTKEPAKTPHADRSRPTWPTAEQGKIIMFRDREYLYLQAEQVWLNLSLSKLQTRISEILDNTKVYPTLRLVGFGSLEMKDGVRTLTDRPSKYFKYMDNSTGHIEIEFDPFPRGLKRDYCILLSMLAKSLRSLVTIEKYDFHDYMSLANMLIFEYFGSGDAEFGRPYDIADIIIRVSGFIGMGVSKSDTYLPEVYEGEGFEKMKNWVYFAILFGLIATRIKALVVPAVLRTVKGSIYTAAAFLEYVLEPEFSKSRKTPLAGAMAPPSNPGWPGSLQTPWLPMYCNEIKNELPFPCTLDDDDKSPNEWKRLMIPYAEFETMESRNGMMPTPLAPYVLKETYVRAVPHCDTIHFMAQFKERNIMYWQMPYSQVDPDGDVDNNERSFRLLLGLMTGAMNCFTDGYTIRPNLRLYDITVIDTSINVFKEPTLVKKEGTLTQGEQMDKPGSIPSDVSKDEGEQIATGERTPADKQRAEQPAQPAKVPDKLGPAAKVGENGS